MHLCIHFLQDKKWSHASYKCSCYKEVTEKSLHDGMKPYVTVLMSKAIRLNRDGSFATGRSVHVVKINFFCFLIAMLAKHFRCCALL
jgi:hypothetical protein